MKEFNLGTASIVMTGVSAIISTALSVCLMDIYSEEEKDSRNPKLIIASMLAITSTGLSLSAIIMNTVHNYKKISPVIELESRGVDQRMLRIVTTRNAMFNRIETSTDDESLPSYRQLMLEERDILIRDVVNIGNPSNQLDNITANNNLQHSRSMN